MKHFKECLLMCTYYDHLKLSALIINILFVEMVFCMWCHFVFVLKFKLVIFINVFFFYSTLTYKSSLCVPLHLVLRVWFLFMLFHALTWIFLRKFDDGFYIKKYILNINFFGCLRFIFSATRWMTEFTIYIRNSNYIKSWMKI